VEGRLVLTYRILATLLFATTLITAKEATFWLRFENVFGIGFVVYFSPILVIFFRMFFENRLMLKLGNGAFPFT
jgi:hypothetical protein